MQTNNQEVISLAEKKQEAWGKMGLFFHNIEEKLKEDSKKAIESIKLPEKFEDINQADADLKELNKIQKTIQKERKVVTSKLDTVSKRLIPYEQFLDEPISNLRKAIVCLKRELEEQNNIERNKNIERTTLIKLFKDSVVEFDGQIQNEISCQILKAYEYSLKNKVVVDKIPKLKDQVVDRIIKFIANNGNIDFEPKLISSDEANSLFEQHGKLTTDYKFLCSDQFDLKFSDYEIALSNSEKAVQAAKEQAVKEQKEVEAKKEAKKVANKLDSASVDVVPESSVKSLKKSYKVKMDETYENAMFIMAAFMANKDLVKPETSTTKWFSFNANSASTALAKYKSKHNDFNPEGILFVEEFK